MEKARLRKYAQLIARMGVNVKEGRDVFVTAGLDQPEFVEMVTEELYLCGARKVFVEFTYSPLSKYHYQYRSLEAASTVENFEEAKLSYMADHLPCRLFLDSADPDALQGVDTEKMSAAQKARFPITRKYRDSIDGRHQWCIAAVPGPKWAQKVFPNETAEVAVEKLWDAILSTSRVNDDPIAAWEEHNKDIHDRCRYLNELQIETLEYRSSNGTDFRVGLIDGARFCGGAETTDTGTVFNPNIPSEECFTSPKKGVAEGIVYSTKPLCYQSQLIEDFWIRFENGKAVEAHAEKNDDLLHKMLSMDEGASYLGECALVPFNSPINQTGLLFYNTLFDENACCHLALGRGFIDVIEDCHSKSKDELHQMGINDSMIHQDFMIGSADLEITAHCKGGKTVAIFKNGTWAF